MNTRTKIASFDQLLRFCDTNRRSMIRCAVRLPKKSNYKHHYILLGHTWNAYYKVFFIIHYSTAPKNAMVVEQIYTQAQVERDIMNGLYVLEDDTYPRDEAQFDEAYSRFEERNGEQRFNILSNNCEHLANYIMTGVAFSDQIEGLSSSEQFLSRIFGRYYTSRPSASSSSIFNHYSSSNSSGRELPEDIMSSVTKKPNFVSKSKLENRLVLCGFFFFVFLSSYSFRISISTEYTYFDTFPILYSYQDVSLLWVVFLVFYCMSFYAVIITTIPLMINVLKTCLSCFLTCLIKERALDKRSKFLLSVLILTLTVFIIFALLCLLIFVRTFWIIINRI